jgi:rare lipoprotein A
LKGQATYYGDKFTGRKTASGDRYRPEAFTAAHRSLPFGTRVRVKRLDGNNEVVCVRINDRGPYGSASRIIDLSKAAAKELAMLRAGVVKVEIEVLKETGAAK